MRAHYLFCMVIALVSCVSVIAADSNEPVDARLQQKVTYQAKHTAVKAILADLSKMTGVTLKAGQSDADWQVRDRKMNVFVKDLPLLSLMNSMARVMKFVWSKNTKTDPPTYRMYMDRVQLAAAQAAKSRADREVSDRIEQSRADLIDYLVNLPDYSPEDLERLKTDNPYLYLMHKRGTDKLFQALFTELPDAVDALVGQDRGLNIPVKILSDETRGILLDAINSDVPVIWEGDGPKQALSKDAAAKQLENGYVRLGVWPRDSVGQPAERLHWLGRVEFYGPEGGKGRYLEHLWVPDSPCTKADCRAELGALERGVQLQESLMASLDDRMQAYRENERMVEDILDCEPPAEHPDEPWLHDRAKAEWDKHDYRLPSVLGTVAEASGFCVVSDSFAVGYRRGTLTSGEQELGGILTAIADGYGYNWERHNRILEFRKRDWFRLRSAQIPDEWMERWKANFKAKGFAVLADIAQMAALTSDQLHENIFRDPVFLTSPEFGWTIQNSRKILRFYNALTPTQRKVLPSMGVELNALSPEQYEVALAAIDGRDSADLNPARFWEAPDEMITFRGENEPAFEEGPAYSIRAVGKDGTVHRHWRIVLREYVEPPEEKPKKEEPKKPDEKAAGEGKEKQPAGK